MSTPRLPKRPPIWVLILLALPLLGVAWVRSTDPLGDRGLTNSATYAGLLLCALIALAWFLIGSGLRARTRFGSLVLGLLGALLVSRVVRIEGWSGSLVPILRVGSAPPPELLTVAAGGGVDLETTSPGDFPGFLGRARDLRVDVAIDPDWDAHPPELLWRRDLGAAWSGFALVNRVAVTMEQRGESQAVTAYGLESGDLLWIHEWPGHFDHVLGGPGPRATPSIDGGRVYALGPRGRLVCLAGTDGSLLWEHDLLAEYGLNAERELELVQYGRANSPLIDGEHVVIPAGGDPVGRQAGLVAFHKLSGERVWEGPPRQLSFASPTRGTLCGREQLLTVNEDSLSGHDPATGALLWEHPWEGRTPANASCSNAVPLPPDRVFVSKGYAGNGGGCTVLRLSVDDGGAFGVEALWYSRRALRTKFTNVVVFGQHAVGLSDGILECAHLEDGRRIWKHGRYGHGQILAVRERLLVLSEQGELLLIDPSPEAGGAVLARQDVLEGKTWNQLALSGDLLAVRNGREASVWRLPLLK